MLSRCASDAFAQRLKARRENLIYPSLPCLVIFVRKPRRFG
jgi:hypothetical protein